MLLIESPTNAGGGVASEAGSFMGDRAQHVIVVGGLGGVMINCEPDFGLVLHITPEESFKSPHKRCSNVWNV